MEKLPSAGDKTLLSRIESEKSTLGFMVQYYCRKHHGGAAPCPNCSNLLEYASNRLDQCQFGDAKKSCLRCPVHCYARPQRQKIRTIMRSVGPRMIYLKPLEALRHLWS